MFHVQSFPSVPQTALLIFIVTGDTYIHKCRNIIHMTDNYENCTGIIEIVRVILNVKALSHQ